MSCKPCIQLKAAINQTYMLIPHPIASSLPARKTSRENTYAELRRVLDENVRSRMKGDEKFQTFVREELASLKNSVSVERQTRERDDGEIVDALVSQLFFFTFEESLGLTAVTRTFELSCFVNHMLR